MTHDRGHEACCIVRGGRAVGLVVVSIWRFSRFDVAGACTSSTGGVGAALRGTQTGIAQRALGQFLMGAAGTGVVGSILVTHGLLANGVTLCL